MARATDRRVKRIFKNAEGYDITVMSDHGQVACVPFYSLHSMSLGDYIEKVAHAQSIELSSAYEGRLTMLSIVIGKTLVFMDYLSAPIRWLGTKCIQSVASTLNPKLEKPAISSAKIVVCDSCCLAHVYFTENKCRMELDEIEKKYPHLVNKLLQTKGIGVIVARQREKVFIMSRDGLVTIGDDIVKRGNDFLSRFGNADVLIEQLNDLAHYENIGDLIIFGDFYDDHGVSFTAHVGTHGGIGGNMTEPFIITKKNFDFSKIKNAREMNRVL
jgi:hypothetical protein